jgi:anti-anti-sigma factor
MVMAKRTVFITIASPLGDLIWVRGVVLKTKYGLVGMMGLEIKKAMLDREKNIYQIALRGELDAHTFEDLQSELEALIDKDVINIVLDMNGVEYVSSAGLGVIAANHANVTGAGGGLYLFGVSKDIYEVFKTMGLSDMLNIVNTREDALSKF